ncbi:MAG: sugar-transfer associated ATP-grasp domain-containing protein [Sulfuricella sp.]
MQNEKESRLSRLTQSLAEYREWASLAQQQTGKSFLTQLREIRALKHTGGQCGISDYYWYKLYDDDYLMGRGAQDFLGWRLQQKFSLALNPRIAVLPAWDKSIFMVTAGSAGLPVAPVRACFHRAERISETLGLHLKSKEAAGAFLRDPSIFPLFGKPAYSQQGFGSAYLAGYDPATDSLNLLDGGSMPVDSFLKRLDETVDHRFHKPECGFLFQDSFKLAPEIHALTNWSAICGVRVICLNGADGVKPIRAIWKIAVPPNHVDNFSLGKYGNMLADVDLATGEVSRMIGGFWPKTEVLLKHPISGRSVEGFRLPGWNKVLEACRHGGAIFPLMKIQHWDFALTDQGPLILELNDMGGTEIAQVHGHGLLTEETREFLKRHANRQTHPWVNAL